jgi:hypothetical protein
MFHLTKWFSFHYHPKVSGVNQSVRGEPKCPGWTKVPAKVFSVIVERKPLRQREHIPLSTITEKTFAGTLVHPGHFGSPRTLWFTPDTLVHPGHFGSPRALVGSLLLIIFSFLFYLYSFCALHPMLPVSLGGPFLVDCPFVPYIQCCLCLLVVHS